MIKKIYLNSINLDSIGDITPDFVAAEFEKSTAYRRETLEFHMSYEEETRMLLLVKNGDVEGVQQLFQNLSSLGVAVGSMSESNLKQSKYLFLCGITMFTRAAIEGGLNEELAYDLSDAYIKCMDRLENQNQVLELSFISALDYAKRVRQMRVSRSTPIKKCCKYINNHLHDKITLSDLATYSGRSESYLSTIFKEQMGIGLNEYILREKLEAARKALLYTEQPIAAIAAQFNFCTHSNFSLHFRRIYGSTPADYRNCNVSIPWKKTNRTTF